MVKIYIKKYFKNKSFNWLIKPHPMDWEYKLVRTNTLIEFEKLPKDQNILSYVQKIYHLTQ